MKSAFELSNDPSDHLLFWFICIPSPYSLPPSLTDESMDILIMQHTLKEVDDLTQTEYVANEERLDLQSVETLYDIVSRAARRTVYGIRP
jgi:hypothetical protein